MDNSPPKNAETQVLQPELQIPQAVSDKDMQMLAMLGGLIGPIIHPLAEAQKTAAIEVTKQAETAAKEATKRTEISATLAKGVYRGIFVIAILILILAVMALAMQKEQTAEKMVFAVVGFLGGLGFGKSQSK